MDLSIESLTGLEGTISLAIRLVGTAIETFGVFIIVAGIAWSTLHGAFSRLSAGAYDRYKTSIGRSLLLGLEVLVAAVALRVHGAHVHEDEVAEVSRELAPDPLQRMHSATAA